MAKIETKLTAEQVVIAKALFTRDYSVTIGKRAGEATATVIPMAEFPAEAWLALMVYGVQRKFNDALGGADRTLESKLGDLAAMIDNFKKGVVGRVAREGVDAFTNAVRVVVRKLVKDGSSKEKWTEFEDMSDDDQDIKLDAIYTGLIEETRAIVDAVARKALEDAAERRVAAAALKASVTVSL